MKCVWCWQVFVTVITLLEDLLTSKWTPGLCTMLG